MAKARSGPLGLAAVVPAPFGGIGVRIADGLITELVYLPPKFGAFAARERVATRAAKQLAHYLVDPDYRFALPLAPAGTPYQQRVWTAISEIPRGQVRSYGALARMLRSGPRAVGQACGANWYPVT